MIPKIGNSALQPSAFGIQGQSSAYGATIPVQMGTVRANLYLIWAANLRKGGESVKQKKGDSVPNYVENVDFLIGTNPCGGPLQIFYQNGQVLDLLFKKWTLSSWGSSIDLDAHDSNAWFINAVTATVPVDPITSAGSIVFTDYGAQGSVTYSGTVEIPLWNTLIVGPNPTNPSGYRWYPWIYTLSPAATNPGGHMLFLDGGTGGLLAPSGILAVTAINVYYSALNPNSKVFSSVNSHQDIPIVALGLTFENVLGDGPEYEGNFINTATPLSEQQVFMPQYCGLGSDQLNLGSGQVIPSILPEISGMYNMYPPMVNGIPSTTSENEIAGGDADYADMMEQIIRSGIVQHALGGKYVANNQTKSRSALQTGLSCFNLPGTIQKVYQESAGGLFSANLHLAVSIGNFLVVFVRFDPGGSVTPSVSDSFGNTWHTVTAMDGLGVFYAPVTIGSPQFNSDGTPKGEVITISGGGSNSQLAAFEVMGLNVFDASTTNSGTSSKPTATITTNYQTDFLMAFINTDGGLIAVNSSTLSPLWNSLITPIPQNVANQAGAAWRTTYASGTFTFTFGASMSTWTVVLLALGLSIPANYPRALGNIIDEESLAIVRAQDRAYGLIGSLNMDSQKSGTDWIGSAISTAEDGANASGSDGISVAANCAPVWKGFKLGFEALAEQSYAANGAVFTAPSSSGPVLNLKADDFTADGQLDYKRKAQYDAPPIQSYQHPNRGSQYNDIVTEEPNAATISLYGPRKGNPTTMKMIYDPAVARLILGIQTRRQNYGGRANYIGTLRLKGILLLPLNLVTLSDPLIGLNNFPARVVSIEEKTDHTFDCEFEPFQFGVYSPRAATVTTPLPYTPTFGYVPANVNPPVFIEPIAGLTPGGSGFPLWIFISDSDVQYGGCQVYMSDDGGNSFQPIGTVSGSATTGKVTTTWPSGADPDSTNALLLDLSESGVNGILTSYTPVQMNALTFPAIVTGGASSPISYECLCYSEVVLTAANQFTIPASDGIRRDVFGAPNEPGAPNANGTGCAHPVSASKTIIGITAGPSGWLKIQTSSAHGFSTGAMLFIPSGVVGTGGLGAYLNTKYWGCTVFDSTHVLLNNTAFAVVTFAEAHSVPGTGPYTVTVTNAVAYISDDGVFYASSGDRFNSVTSVNAITAATNADPAVFTVAQAPTDGSTVRIAGFTGGWTSANNDFTASQIDDTHFSIPLDSSAFGSISGSPTFTAQGAYSVNTGTGVYTFSPLDASQPVEINYTSTASYISGGTIKEQPRFAVVGNMQGAGPGQIAIQLTQKQVGTPLHFKFLQFNETGSGFGQIQDVTDYTYTPLGLGSDTGLPSTPVPELTPGTFAVATKGTLQIGSGLSGPGSWVNVDSVYSESFEVGYYDETGDNESTLAGGVGSGATSITTAAPLSNVAIGDFLSVGTEIYQLTSTASAPIYGVSPAAQGSTTSAHSSGSPVCVLLTTTFNRLWGPGSFLVAQNFAGTQPIAPSVSTFPFVDARVAWITSTLTNDFGSVTGPPVAFMLSDTVSTTHFGSRTLYGGSLASSNLAVLKVQTNWLPAITSPSQVVRPWTVYATLATVATGADVHITINVNGSSWATLIITAGSTVSNELSGADFPPIPSGAIITVDVTQIGSTYQGDGLAISLQL